jgi:hypothetical protein
VYVFVKVMKDSVLLFLGNECGYAGKFPYSESCAVGGRVIDST